MQKLYNIEHNTEKIKQHQTIITYNIMYKTRQYQTIQYNTHNNIITNIVMYCTILYNIRQNATISNNIDIQYLHTILYDIVLCFVTNIGQYCKQH